MSQWREHQRAIIDSLPPLTYEQNRQLTRVAVKHGRH